MAKGGRTMQPIGYSYVRFSSKKQTKGSSFHRQTEDTCAGESPASWCARNNVVFDTSLTFRDLGVSAYAGLNAKQGELRAFLDAVASGRVRPGAYLLVERVDRISRQGIDEGMDLIKSILRAGVHIVTLGNGRVYGPEAVKGLMKGSLELQMYLEQAQQFSETLSKRVSAAWELKRKKARTKTLATTMMPPWLRAVGEGDDRRAVVIPEKAALVKRLFDLAIAGHGLTKILRIVVEDGTFPLTRKGWSRTSIRRFLTDRAVLGEYQPMLCRARKREPQGDPITDYYPAIITQATFHRASACMGNRKVNNIGRESKMVNVFSGLLKDARSGCSYIHGLRIEQKTKRHFILYASNRIGCVNSFPFKIFEQLMLDKLREIDPRELIPENRAADDVLALAGELATIEGEIAAIAAEMDREYSETLAGVLRRKESRKKSVAVALAEARQRAASPISEAWGEAGSLFDLIQSSPEPDNLKLRLRVILRRMIESIHLLVVPRCRDRLVGVQIWFAEGAHRDYVFFQRPPRANGSACAPGFAIGKTLTDAVGNIDLRVQTHVEALERWLLTTPIEDFIKGQP